MTRRVTAGAAGGAGLQGLQAFTTRITSAANLDITVDPTGTGRFLVAGPAQIENQNPLRFADSNSSNWVAFQSPATVASNVTWTLPATDGSNRQTLTTNGSGTLTWETPTILVNDNTSDSATHFVTLTTATTNTAITEIRRSSSKLTFQPSTGNLTVSGSLSSGTISSNTITVTHSNTNYTNGLVFNNTADWGYGSRILFRVPLTSGGAVGDAASIEQNFEASNAMDLRFSTTSAGTLTTRCRITSAGHFVPHVNNTYDLGTSALRWRTIFTQDLELSNGIGDYTIVEGEDDLFVYNNKRGKVYKFALIEVDPSEATPKIEDLNKVK